MIFWKYVSARLFFFVHFFCAIINFFCVIGESNVLDFSASLYQDTPSRQIPKHKSPIMLEWIENKTNWLRVFIKRRFLRAIGHWLQSFHDDAVDMMGEWQMNFKQNSLTKNRGFFDLFKQKKQNNFKTLVSRWKKKKKLFHFHHFKY